jgi:hypothetical protein
VTARVNELLKSYGFTMIHAQEHPYSTWENMAAEARDHAYNFRRNSYVMRLPVVFVLGGTPPGLTDACELAKGVPGYKKTESCYNDMHVKLGSVGVDTSFDSRRVAKDESGDRERAVLAVLIVHEFVHGVMDRMLAESVAGSADKKDGCKPQLDAAWAKSRSEALHKTLGICAGARHQAEGLLAAGGVLKGNPCADTGGGGNETPTVIRCLYDKTLPDSAAKSLAGGSSISAQCSGVALGKYLRLPQAPLIASYLSKRAGQACYDACYYAAKK